MLRSGIVSALLAAAFVLAPARSHAQRDIDIERFHPSLDADSFLGIQGTRTPSPGEWNTTLWLTYSRRPLVLAIDGAGEPALVRDRLGADLSLQVGLGGRLALAASVPLVLYQHTDASLLGEDAPAIAAQAFGDPRLFARLRFLGESSSILRDRHEGPGLAVQAEAAIPVGTDDAFAGEGALRAGLAFLADFHILGAGIGAQLGYRHRFQTRELGNPPITFRDELEAGIALKVPTVVIPEVFGIFELRVATDAGSPFDGPRTAGEIDLGFRAFLGDVTLTLGGGIGITGGVGAPAARGIAAFSWAPRVADSDRDGIYDNRDECDHLPEDFDGFEDADGCLDPDNDNDLIPDADDQCPAVAAEEDRDEDEDGCTDPVRDADRDGIEDGSDACPEQAEDRDGDADEDGCPDPDDDDDGVALADDRCPREAEDRDGHQDEDGCPDPDDDGDGRLDAEDPCPREAEDVDTVEDADGCPDPDNDHDGVLDAADTCPAGAETINGVRDDDGCPDTGGRLRWTIQGDTLRGTIRAGADGRLAPASTPAIDQLARLLIARLPRRASIAAGPETLQDPLHAALVARGVPEAAITITAPAAGTAAGTVLIQIAPAAPAPTPAPSQQP